MRHIAAICVLLLALLGAAAAALPKVAASGDDAVWMLYGTEKLGSGRQEALVIYGGSGNSWYRTWGRGVDVYPKDLTVDNTGAAVFVADYGVIPQEEYVPLPACVVRISPSGSIIWEKEISFSDHSLRLDSVTTDNVGNIYACGQAWKYAPDPEPEGWYPIRGYIFTLKLSQSGEVVWARRWSADFFDFDLGLSLAVNGSNLAVLSEYSGPLSSNEPAPLLLVYDNSTGFLLDSLAFPREGEPVYPRALAVNSAGIVMAVCEIPHHLVDVEISRDLYQLYFNIDTEYMFSEGVMARQNDFLSAWDLSSSGEEFFIAGGIASRPIPPDPAWPEHNVINPYLMHFKGVYPADEAGIRESSEKYSDAMLTSVAASPSGTVWVCGLLTNPGEELDIYHYNPGAWFNYDPPVEVIAWEEENCGSNSFDIHGSSFVAVSQTAVLDLIEAERLHLGDLIWDYTLHQPDAFLTASVTEGTAPLTVTFDASGSTINEGYIAEYYFDFWNKATSLGETGGVGTESVHEHTFQNPGIYEARLVVTSDDDTKAWASVTITVK